MMRTFETRCWVGSNPPSRQQIIKSSHQSPNPPTNTHHQKQLHAKTMEQAFDQLARLAISNSKLSSPSQRYIIGVGGSPGSGKSTLAREVVRRINYVMRSEIAINVPMDGFHYYKRELDAMDDPQEAYARRGAHWTFDAQAYVECLQSLKERPDAQDPTKNKVSKAPSFDHGVGDPIKDNIKIYPRHKIIISEGNYVLLDIHPWSTLIDSHIFDDTWYVDCSINEAMQRIFRRQTTNGLKPEESQKRIIGNDRPNAELVATTKERANIIVPSVPFQWR